MENVDLNELNKFESMAKSWWDPKGDFRPLHLLNPVRVNYIAERSAGLFAKNILDIGCGGGILSESMAKMGAEVVGIDLAFEPLEVAKSHAKESGLTIDYQQISVEDFAQQCQIEGRQFDVITCMEVLEHVPNPAAMIQQCQKLLKPNGKLFLSTINRTLKSYCLVIIGAEYILRLLPKGTHDFKKFAKPAELLHYCDQAQLVCRDMVGYHFNPLTETFWLNQNVSCNYIVELVHQ